ncbi:hypothetical protein EV702DRAFT_1053219 [Suillus placidus]|uniref:Uncharacterized protein n=1 Tax=Suillus placidus TaxID=48579 RepID=A0A9P7CUL8_9AGAM|nr:hypothetical protein EV702DRAFT_1053219 [Suillus placidus]
MFWIRLFPDFHTTSYTPVLYHTQQQQANNELNLITEKICQLVTRSTKLKVGDPAAKALAHEIANTLATTLAQHGSTATSLAPLLLSCAAEIRANCGLNGRLKTLPDWNVILDDDPCIHLHPLFQKTMGLFVVGNGPKRKATEPEPKVVEAPASKKCKMCQSLREAGRAPPWAMNRAPCSKVKVKLKDFISNDEDVLTNKVTHIKAETGTTVQLAVAQQAKSLDAEDTDSSAEDNNSDNKCSTAHLFGVQCERCIKDDVACTVVLGKKQGEVRKCCLNCNMTKTKCVHPNPDQEQFLRAALALKKAKSAQPDTGLPMDQTVSAVGRQYTTAWDDPKGIESTGPGNLPAPVIRASSEPLQPNVSLPLSSLPSASSSHKD